MSFGDLPAGKYGVILADPPWSFRSWSDKGKNRAPDALVRQKGLAERHYKTMSMKQIRDLPVGLLAKPNAVLLLWVPDCMLPTGITMAESWGFTFKTVAFTWVKRTKSDAFHIGLGYWTRGNPEQCLLFTRGSPRRFARDVRQLIDAPRREHSRKPDEQYERIERLLLGPYVELFARQRRPGWDTWGDQTNRFPEAA